MTRKELREELLGAGVRTDAFSLDGRRIPDAMIMEEAYESWTVFYYDERGNRDLEKEFDSEDAACRYLFEVLSNEPSYKERK